MQIFPFCFAKAIKNTHREKPTTFSEINFPFLDCAVSNPTSVTFVSCDLPEIVLFKDYLEKYEIHVINSLNVLRF
jgi:hypothetical protein